MSEETSTISEEVEDILRRLLEAQEALIETASRITTDQFQEEREDGPSVKRIMERAADDVNFYYGRLVANARSLPQPPYIEPADFASLAEATASLQEAHRSLTNLLHDLRPEDLERRARLEETSDFTLRQVLETATAHYRLRADQLNTIVGGPAKEGDKHERRRRRR